jgi:hypothetical protein
MLPRGATAGSVRSGGHRPRTVKCLLIEREKPAGGDLAVPGSVQADRRPPMFCSVDQRCSISENSEVLPIANEKLPGMESQRISGEVTAPLKVIDDFPDPAIHAGNRVIARDVPFDVVGEQSPHRVDLASCVHHILCRMKPVEKFASG